jgi:poly-gamma-glutamate capsule biosynthesis protein CapA/YwtB (metallophosphatase superfamily)
MRIWSLRSIPLVLGMIGSAQTQPADRSATLRITVVGQSSIHSDLRKTAPAAVEQARKYLGNADVRFTNLEVAVAPGDAAVEPHRNAERVDPQVLDCLREMGFNLLSLSNNHALDLGMEGLRTTRAEVARRGFGFAGTGANLAEALAAGFVDTPAGRVGLIGMASGAEGQLPPETWAAPDHAGVNFLEQRKDGTLNPEQASRILEAVRKAARESAGVIVYQHNHYWGDGQGSGLPPGRTKTISRFETHQWQVEWAHQLIDAGAILYVAHGDPSLHGVEIYKGRPIFYSLGNFIFQSPLSSIGLDTYGPLAYMSAIAQVEFRGGRVSALHFVPIVLSMNAGDTPRGVPYVAEGREARTILLGLADASKQFGTEIRIDGDSASVILGKRQQR